MRYVSRIARKGRRAVTEASFCRSDPAAALRGLANWRTPVGSNASPFASAFSRASSSSCALSARKASFSM